MEMDFHGMKRKALQALCKKHRLPANVTNLEMADTLAALVKVNDEAKTKGSSSSEESGEIAVQDAGEGPDDHKIIKKSQKKVTFYFDEEQTAKMSDNQRNPVGKLPPKKTSRRASLMKSEVKAQLDCTGEASVENVVEMKEISIRTTRSRAERLSEAVSAVPPPVLCETKKAGKGAKLKNCEVDVDKPPPDVEGDKPKIARGVAEKVSVVEDGVPVTRSLRGRKVLPVSKSVEISEGTQVVGEKKENSPRKTRFGESLKKDTVPGQGDFELSKNSRKTRSQNLTHVETRDAMEEILPPDEVSGANSENITQKVGARGLEENGKYSQPGKAARRSKRNATEVESSDKDGGDVGPSKNSRWTRSQKLKTAEAKVAMEEILSADEGSNVNSGNITRKSGAEVQEESGKHSQPGRATRRSKRNAPKEEQTGEIVQRNNPRKRARDQGPEVLHVPENEPEAEVIQESKTIDQFEGPTRRQTKLNALKSDLSAASSPEKRSREKIRKKETQKRPRKEDLKQSASDVKSRNRTETGSQVQEEIGDIVQLPRRSIRRAYTNETSDPSDGSNGARRKGGKVVEDDGVTEGWGRAKLLTSQIGRGKGRKVAEVDTKVAPSRDAEQLAMEPEENSAEPVSILSKHIPVEVKQKLHSGMESGEKRLTCHVDMRSSIEKNSIDEDQRADNPDRKTPVNFGLNETTMLGEKTLESSVTVQCFNTSADQKVQLQDTVDDLSVAKEEKGIQSGREVLEERTLVVPREDQVIGLCMDSEPQNDVFDSCEMEKEIVKNKTPVVGMEGSAVEVSNEGKKCDAMEKNESTQSPPAVAEAENEIIITTVGLDNGDTEILDVGATKTVSKSNYVANEESSIAKDFDIFPIFDCKPGQNVDVKAAVATDSEVVITLKETTGTVSDDQDTEADKVVKVENTTKTVSKSNFGANEESSLPRDSENFPIFDCKREQNVDVEGAAATDSEVVIMVRETTGTLSDDPHTQADEVVEVEKTIKTVPECTAYIDSEGSALLGDVEIPELVRKQTPGCVKALEVDAVVPDRAASPRDDDIPPAHRIDDHRNQITHVLDMENLDQEFGGDEVKDNRKKAAAEEDSKEFACENGSVHTFPEECNIEGGEVNEHHKVVPGSSREATEVVATELTQDQDNVKVKDNSEEVAERKDDITKEMASFGSGEKAKHKLSKDKSDFEIEMGTYELSLGITLPLYMNGSGSPGFTPAEEEDSLHKGVPLAEKDRKGNDEGKFQCSMFKDSNFVCENDKVEDLDKLVREAASPAQLWEVYDSPMQNDEKMISSNITQEVEMEKEAQPVQEERAEMEDEMRTVKTVIEELECENHGADLEQKIMELGDPEEIDCKDCEEVAACVEVCNGSAAQEKVSFGDNEVVEVTEKTEYIDKNSGSESNGKMPHAKEKVRTTIEVAVIGETDKETSELQGKKHGENAGASASSITLRMPIPQHCRERNPGQVKFAMPEDSLSREEASSISGMYDSEGEDCFVHGAFAASETMEENEHLHDNVGVEISTCNEKTMHQQVVSVAKYKEGRTSGQVQLALLTNELSYEKAIKDYDEGGEYSSHEAVTTMETMEGDESLLNNARIGISILGEAPEGSGAYQTEIEEQSETIRTSQNILNELGQKDCREGLLEMTARVAPREQESLAHNTFVSDETSGKEDSANVELFRCGNSVEGAEAVESKVIEECNASEAPQSVLRQPGLDVFQEMLKEEPVTPVAIQRVEASPHEAMAGAQITGEDKRLACNAGFEELNNEKAQGVVGQLVLEVFEETLKVEAGSKVGMEMRDCIPHEALDANEIMEKDECLVGDANVTSKSGDVPEAMQTEHKDKRAVSQALESVVGEHIVEVLEETLKVEAVTSVAVERQKFSSPEALNNIEIMGEDRCLVGDGNVEMSRYGRSLVVARTMLTDLKEDINASKEPGSTVRDPSLEVLKESLNMEPGTQMEGGESSPDEAPDAAEIIGKDGFHVDISGVSELNSEKVHEVEGAKEDQLEEESGRVIAVQTSVEEISKDSEENLEVETIAPVALRETCPEDHQDVLQVNGSVEAVSAVLHYKDSEAAEGKQKPMREEELYCNDGEIVPDENKNDCNEFQNVMEGKDKAEAVSEINYKDTEVSEDKENAATETEKFHCNDGEDVTERSTNAKSLQKSNSDGCKGVALSKVVRMSTSQRDYVDPTEFSEVGPALVVSPLKPQIGAYNCSLENLQRHSRFELVSGSNVHKISEASTLLTEVECHADASNLKSESGLNNTAMVNFAALTVNSSECYASNLAAGQYSQNKQIVEVNQPEEGYDVRAEVETSVQNYDETAPSGAANDLLKNGDKTGEVAQAIVEEVPKEECKESEDVGAVADFKEAANANADTNQSPSFIDPVEYRNENKYSSLSSTEVASRKGSDTAEGREEYKVGDICGSCNTSSAIKDNQICSLTSELEAQVEEITSLFNETYILTAKAEKKASRTQKKSLKPVNSLKHWANTAEMKENTPVAKKVHPSNRKVAKSATPISRRRPLENLQQSSRKREETFRLFNNWR